MKWYKLKNNKVKAFNDGSVAVTIYEFPKTKYERPITLKPNESVILRTKLPIRKKVKGGE